MVDEACMNKPRKNNKYAIGAAVTNVPLFDCAQFGTVTTIIAQRLYNVTYIPHRPPNECVSNSSDKQYHVFVADKAVLMCW